MSIRLPARLASFLLMGANTGVGKTAVAAGLAAASRRADSPWMYVKPIQTGYPKDCDASTVARAARIDPVERGPHATDVWKKRRFGNAVGGERTMASDPKRRCVVLYAWEAPTSPDLACSSEGRHVSDPRIVARLSHELRDFHSTIHAGGVEQSMVLIEGAGGPASPGPSGSLQCDLFRPFRFPVILVGDTRLGGISSTISAYETLLMRGYDVDAVVLVGGGLGNEKAIRRHVDEPTDVWHIRQSLEGDGPGPEVSEMDPAMKTWIEDTSDSFDAFRRRLLEKASNRTSNLQTMAQRARKTFWWPFTQHKSMNSETNVIDGRCGEHLMLFQRDQSSSQSGEEFRASFDGVASWWTQGVSAYQSTKLVRNIAQAAGRYGHVIFPESVHAPALDLAERLLRGVGHNWASRVFFSDDGSTAVEVGIKMALRKYAKDHGIPLHNHGDEPLDLHVIGLQDSYHGDTLGAMQCSPPSIFNGVMQSPWYRAHGFFLDPPQAAICQGRWKILPTKELEGKLVHGSARTELALPSKVALFAVDREQNTLANVYRQTICNSLDQATIDGRRLGACIMEVILQGAGGMNLIDPLWQRLVVQECRRRGIPVIFDEVFSGIWRLGAQSAAELLQETPDIGCYAKLLTGGTLPLSVTLATEDVFRAFQGPSKVEALLHGHSYTAHPIGCQVSSAALDIYSDSRWNPNYPDLTKLNLLESNEAIHDKPKLLDLWDEDAAMEISFHPRVRRVVPLGTVFAIEIKAEDAGYGSSASAKVVSALRSHGIFARPLGNVVYVMATPTTTRVACNRLLKKFSVALNASC